MHRRVIQPPPPPVAAAVLDAASDAEILQAVASLPGPELPIWVVEACPDEAWSVAEPLIPRPPDHPLGCHRPRCRDRVVLAALLLLARSGYPLREARALGLSKSTLHRRRSEWERAGVFAAIRAAGHL